MNRLSKTIFALLLVSLVSCSSKASTDNAFEIHNELQLAWLNDEESIYNMDTYADGTKELSQPNAYKIRFADEKTNSNYYKVVISESSDYSLNKYEFQSYTRTYAMDAENLKLNTQYYYKVIDLNSNETIKESSFKTKDGIIRNIYIDGVTNCRDMGGYITKDNHVVKQGLLYRTARLGDSDSAINITEKGRDIMLNQLGIKSEIDLRSETNMDHSLLSPETNYYHYPFVTYNNKFLFINRELAVDVFHKLADINNYPMFYHCAIGTDRTGAVAFNLLGLLGVSYKDAIRDYLFSNFGFIGSLREIHNLCQDNVDFASKDGIENFQATTIDYLVNEIGVSMEDITSIQNILLEK